jgi:hypothetical protein
MFETFKIEDYTTEPTQYDKDNVNYSIKHMHNHDTIVSAFVDNARKLALCEYYLARLSERMKYIDSQPEITVIRMDRPRHSTSISVGVYKTNKNFEGGPFYGGGNLVLGEDEIIRNFTGREKAKAFDCAIALVKANPGSNFIVTGDLAIFNIPKRARPFSRNFFEQPQKKVK